MILMKIDFLFVLFNIIFQVKTSTWKYSENIYSFKVSTKGGRNFETGEKIEKITVNLSQYNGTKLLIFNFSMFQTKDDYYTKLLTLAKIVTKNNIKMMAFENDTFNTILKSQITEALNVTIQPTDEASSSTTLRLFGESIRLSK